MSDKSYKGIIKKCKCGNRIFCSKHIDIILSTGIVHMNCPTCNSDIFIEEYAIIIRQNKIKRIKYKINGSSSKKI